MEISNKIFIKSVIIIIFALLMILSDNVFAQRETLHDQTLEEIVKQNPGLDQIGNSPTAMHVDEGTNTIYVANFDSDTVSVISRENFTIIEEIPVGRGPVAMHVDEGTNTIYVVNRDSDSVSVITTMPNNTRIVEGIDIGRGPIAMHIDEGTNTIYVANFDSDTVSVISRENFTIIEEIPVGVLPIDIDADRYYDTNTFRYRDALYVANALDDTVSVIDTENNTKIQSDIAVGREPTAIEVYANTIYVANSDSDTVSVISRENFTIIEEIPVGDYPTDIAVYTDYSSDRRYVYVANSHSDTVSVIFRDNYTIIEEIPVGDYPTDIAVDNELSDRIYVANNDSDSISVIDTVSNTAVEGVVFQVNPVDSGFIQCGELRVPSSVERDKYIYVKSRAECIAKPVKGFEFVSWVENLGGNSTQVIKASPPASLWYSTADFLGIELVEPEAKLNLTRFGNFTANFKEVPPPLPPEFWAQMYAVIGTVVTALFIPSIVGWFKSKREGKKLSYFHKQIASLYGDGKLDENDIDALDRLRNRVGDAYSKGKLNEKHYESLKNEISTLYEEIFRKKLATLDSNNNYSVVKKPIQQQLAQIRNDIKYAFSKGKINEKHYALLNEDISKLDGKEGVKAS